MQNTTGRIQPRVQRRCGGGNHDQLHDRGARGHANIVEEGHEGRLVIAVDGVRHEQAQQHYGAHVEDSNAPHHSVDSARNNLLDVLCFAGGGAHQLDTGICEHHALHDD